MQAIVETVRCVSYKTSNMRIGLSVHAERPSHTFCSFAHQMTTGRFTVFQSCTSNDNWKIIASWLTYCLRPYAAVVPHAIAPLPGKHPHLHQRPSAHESAARSLRSPSAGDVVGDVLDHLVEDHADPLRSALDHALRLVGHDVARDVVGIENRQEGDA